MIHQFNGKIPKVHEETFVAASSDIIGEVCIGKDSNIWFGTVIRGN